jgi:hypothetical protein
MASIYYIIIVNKIKNYVEKNTFRHLTGFYSKNRDSKIEKFSYDNPTTLGLRFCKFFFENVPKLSQIH